jgi:hypothetical protein
VKEAQILILYHALPKNLWLDYSKLHPSSGADEVNGQSLQLITAVHDEFDHLTFCEQHS